MPLISRLLSVMLLLAVAVSAQDRGTIRGTVTDPTGAAVVGATVTTKNVATGLTQTTQTGVDGTYTFLYLPAGTYTVTVTMAGFRTAETPNVQVNVATVTAVDVQLTVGGVAETVEVSAAVGPLLDMQGTNLGKIVPTNVIRDLPLFISGGIRSNLAFVILTPGVIGSASNPRIAGGLLDGQSEQLDGAEAQSERRNDPAMNGVSVEGMQEFKVQSSSYTAEYGRTSNGVINWVTKSGTNELHGSAFAFNRNEFFNARGFTHEPSARPVIRTWNPGGSLGGPIYIPNVYDGRNKAFFFFAYERAMNQTGQSTEMRSLVVDEFRMGDMRRNVDSTGNTIPLYDPFDAAGNVIPNALDRPRMQCRGVLDVICPERIDPLAKAAIAMLPPVDDPTKITQNYRSRRWTESITNLPSIKLDYVFNEKHRINFLYSHYWSPAQPYRNHIEGLPGDGWNTDVLIDYYRINYDYVIAPNVLSHLTIGFNKRNLFEAPPSIWDAPEEWASLFALKGLPEGNTPIPKGLTTKFSAGGISWGNSVITDSRSRTIDFKEQIAWIKGTHTLKFGMQYLKGQYRRLDRNNAYGTIGFSAAGTGHPLVGNSGSDWASFLLGVASSGSFRYYSDTTFQFPYYAWYVQDDWKVNQKLTLNIGLRYEIPIPKKERNLRNSNFCPTCPNPAAGGLPGAMIFAGRDGAPERFGETRMNAFGPRLGFAYQLDSKTVIRSGGAIYYQPIREDGNADNGIQGFGGSFSATPNYLSSGIAFLRKDGLTAFSDEIKANTPPVIDPTIQLYGTPFYYNPKAGRAPYFGDWNFTIDRTVGQNSLFRVSYHGVVGVKMLSRQQSQNQLHPMYWSIYGTKLSLPIETALQDPEVIAKGFKLPFEGYRTNLQLQQALRPFPQYTNVDSNAGGQNDGHSTYHALATSFERQFANGFYTLVSYTFAKLISTTNGEDANRASDGVVQNQYDRRADKAVASQDTPHNIRIAYVYELPFGRGQRWLSNLHPVLNGFLGNWKISGIHSYVSGTPLRFTCNQNLYGAGSGRCSYALGVSDGSVPLINPDWSPDYDTAFSVPQLNTAAVVRPPNMTYGDTPRRISYLRTKWSQSEQIAIMKNFRLTESANLEIRASANNPLNRVTLGDFNTSQTSPDFGRITTPQGNSPRNIQLGARISF